MNTRKKAVRKNTKAAKPGIPDDHKIDQPETTGETEEMVGIKAPSLEEEVARYAEYGGDYELVKNETNAIGSDLRNAINLPRFSVTFWKGSIVNKQTPESQYKFSLRETEAKTREDMLRFLDLEKRGWFMCDSNTFWIHPEYREVLKPNSNGIYTLGGADENSLLLMAMPRERYEKHLEYNRRYSRDVAKSAEEKMAESGRKVVSMGGMPVFEVTTEDNYGNVIDKR